jgi:LysM repeat protein
VAANNVQVVYIKASEGSQYIDSQFENNYTNAKAHGLKVGFYHYVTATTTDQAVQQAKFFVSVIGGKEPDCKLAMDFEKFGNLSAAQINKIALTFIRTVEEVSGRKAIVYSDLYNTKVVFDSSLAPYPLWIAEYGVSTPGNSKVWSDWVGFQYSDTGKISGISGNVDLDKYTDGVFLTTTPGPIVKTNPPPSLCPGENVSYYTVKKGDTLSAIAKKYQTTVSCILSLNKISNQNLIHVGETLKIYTIAKPAPNSSTYRVVSGDTLYRIALKYHTTVAKLAALNNIKNPNLIYAGQIIKLH